MVAPITKPAPGRTPPHSVEAEEQLLSAILLDGGDVLARADDAGIEPASFYVPANRVIFQRLYAMHVAGKPVDLAVLAEELKKSGQLDELGGYAYLTRISERVPTTAGVAQFIERLRELATRRKVIEAARAALEQAHNEGHDLENILAPLRTAGEGKDSLGERLRSALLTFEAPPVEPAPRWFIDRKPIATPGNLTAIIAQAKSGKTTWAAALVAACIVADNEARGMETGLFDTLGAQAAAPGGRVLVYFDTEQTRFDGYKSFLRACRRAGMDRPPEWVRSYNLKGWSAAEARKAVRHVVRDLIRRKISVFAIIVDGLADLAADVNDAEESNDLVCEMESHAVACDCPVVCVIHRNEGQKADSAARGHLGKQLARKAETNLRLEKRDGKTVVFADQNRGAPITEKDGPCFAWSEEKGCHVSCASVGQTRAEAHLEESRCLVAEAIKEGEELTYTALVERIQQARDISKKRAQTWLTRLKHDRLIIQIQGGRYTAA